MPIVSVKPGCQFASDNTAPMSPGAWESLARANEECQSSYGDDSWTAAGSVITEGVPPGSLAIGRERQENKDGYDARRKSDGTDKK